MPPAPEEPVVPQAKLLAMAQHTVQTEAMQMKRTLDKGKLMEALKHTSNMLNELRTSLLSPKNYYVLYMHITDELRHLEAFLVDEIRESPDSSTGRHKLDDFYELVQYAGNIVPRLYLLITVGSVYIKAKKVPKKDIMKDLVEMCRGVQHPLRGLFLRHYLLSCVKSDLPTDDKDPSHGLLSDSIDFILLNFSEMNKLWVRMQHQGHSRERTQREKERQELRLLVGTNLVRLSSLENITIAIYEESVLPSLLEQVTSCKDAIAQEYLMESLIQVFPDKNHIHTLDPFLLTCGKLSPRVNVKNIIICLIDRLADFVRRDGTGAVPEHIDLFEIFSTQISAVVSARPDMPVDDIIALQSSLISLALQCYPEQYDYVDTVLESTSEILTKIGTENIEMPTPECKSLMALVKLLVDTYPSVITLLELEHFVPLFSYFGFNSRKDLAVHVVQRLTTCCISLTDTEQVTTFLEIIAPLVKDQPDQPADAHDDEEFNEEQWLVGRFIVLLKADVPDMQMLILQLARKHFGTGGETRIKFTLPPLVFLAIQLTSWYKAISDTDKLWEKKVGKIFNFCHQTITALARADFTELALRLFLQAAMAADRCNFEKSESIAYEFMSQAFLLYEEDISDSKAQMAAITLIIGTLEAMTCFGDDNFAPLSSKCAVISSKLLKKPDQVRGVCMCSHIFWSGKTSETEGEREDAKQVLQCLQKALKVAKSCMEPQVQLQLFVEIFNRYILYFEKGTESITMSYLNKITALIRDNLDSLEPSDESTQIQQHFENTLAHVERKKAQGDGDGRSFADFAS